MISSLVIDPRIKVRDPALLLTMPRVIRITEFDEEAAQKFANEVSLTHQTGQTILPIIVDSYGGDIYALWSMIDTIKTSPLTIATIIEGKAMSCGAVFFTCGHEGYRYMGPNATIMIHDAGFDDIGGKKSEDLKIESKEIDRLNRKLYRMMERNIGKPVDYLWDLAQQRGRTDWYVTPKEALRHNIANRIGIPTFKTTVKVETELDK